MARSKDVQISSDSNGVLDSIKHAAEGAAHALQSEVRDLFGSSGVSKSAGDAQSYLPHLELPSEKQVGDALSSIGHQVQLFGEGVVTGAILNPLNGIDQLVNHVAGTHLPNVEFSNQQEVNNSIAGKVGEFAGTAALMVATDGAVGAVGAATGISALEAGSALSLGVTGAIQGGLLTPSDSSKQGGDFFADRLENAGISAVTFATMGGVAKLTGLGSAGGTLVDRVVGQAAANGIGGAAGGVVSAEGQALKDHGRLATGSELAGSVLQNAFIGGAFGAGSELGGAAIQSATDAVRGDIKPNEDIYARTRSASPQAKKVAQMVDLKSDVSPSFMRNVVGAVGDLKPEELDLLNGHNVRVTAGESIADIDPTMVNQVPRGWKSGTWANADGFYRDGSPNMAVVTEKRVPMGGTGFEDSPRTPGVIRHEIGHGVDSALGNASQTPDFLLAHQNDIAKLSPQALKDFEYYIQSADPKAGASEAFAELFASMRGGGAGTNKEYILRSFPETQALINDMLAKATGVPNQASLSAVAKFRNRIMKAFN